MGITTSNIYDLLQHGILFWTQLKNGSWNQQKSSVENLIFWQFLWPIKTHRFNHLVKGTFLFTRNLMVLIGIALFLYDFKVIL